MANPLNTIGMNIRLPGLDDVGGVILDTGGDIVKGGCGLFPKIGRGQTCQGISFGNGCCAGLVTGPGDVGGPGSACPPGTRPSRPPEIAGICVSDTQLVGNGGGVQPQQNGRGGGRVAGTLVNGKVCCPSGFKKASDGSTDCVRTRKTNFGNASAARRAVSRLAGAQRLLRGIEKLVDKNVRPARTARRRSSPRKSACGCP
jgi:hypothetical protein